MPEILFNNNNTLRQQVDENTENIKKIAESHLVDVDDELSTTSTNAVQNKIITEALQTEEFERKQADEDLENADIILQNNIDAETLARQQADQNLQNQLTPGIWQLATPNTTTLHSGSCKYCKVGKIVFCYIDTVVINSGISGGGSGVVELFTGLPATNHGIVFILPAYFAKTGADIRCYLNNGTISLHWSSEESFGDVGNHHNLIFSYVEV